MTESSKQERARRRRIKRAYLIRERVSAALLRGKLASCYASGCDGGSWERVLAWFRLSIFEGDMKQLRFALKYLPPIHKPGGFMGRIA